MYPEGLNGSLEPLWAPLLKLPIWDTESTCESTQLQVTLPRTTWGDIPKAIHLWSSMLTSSLHSVTECPSYIATGPSMAEEIEELFSSTMLKMPGQFSAHTSPRRLPPMALAIQWPVGGIPSNLGETIIIYLKQPPPSPQGSSQAGMADVMAHSSCSPTPMLGSPERDSSLTPLQLQVNSITLPDDVLHLQGEMNDNMVHLLTVRASIDAHQQRIMSEMEVAHCQNEIKTSEAIREVKASYAAALGNAEATYVTAVRKVTTHSTSTSEVEAAHATAVRKAGAASAAQALKLQQTH